MTCVCLNGYSKLNSQYLYKGIVRFESQEKYSFGGKMQYFAKLIKDKTDLGKVRHDESFHNLYIEEIIDFALRS